MINILELEASKGWGGQEKRTIRLVNNLDKNKFKVFWAVQPDSTLMKNRESIEAEFIALKQRKSYDIAAILKVISIVKRHNIDIICTHSGKDAWIGAIAGLFCRAKVVRVRHLQTPINSPRSYNLSDKVVTVSRQVKNYLVRRGVREDKLSVIYTGIDTERFTPEKKIDLRDELNLSRQTVLIGIIAVLRAAKRHVDLLDAFSRIKSQKNVALAIIGTGPQEENIGKYIREHAISNVFMLGHREDIDEILPSLDIFVLPSQMEALGTAILEASSCGVPCIVSDAGGMPETIADGKTGYLFPSENIDELENRLELLVNDENLRYEFGKNARDFIMNNFSVKKMVNETEKLYQELAK